MVHLSDILHATFSWIRLNIDSIVLGGSFSWFIANYSPHDQAIWFSFPCSLMFTPNVDLPSVWFTSIPITSFSFVKYLEQIVLPFAQITAPLNFVSSFAFASRINCVIMFSVARRVFNATYSYLLAVFFMTMLILWFCLLICWTKSSKFWYRIHFLSVFTDVSAKQAKSGGLIF